MGRTGAEAQTSARRRLGTLIATIVIALGAGVASVVAMVGDPEPERPRRRPRLAFADATRRFGVPEVATRSWGQALADHDRDGWVDLLLGRHLRAAAFFTGGKRGLERVDAPALAITAPDRYYYDRHSCAWGEADGDGKPDLYCVSGAQKGLGIGPNQLLTQAGAPLPPISTRNGVAMRPISDSKNPARGGRDLVDATEAAGLVDLMGRGRSVNWLDLDADGDLDIFVGNEARAGQPNRTFRNEGAGAFLEVDVGLTEEFATMSSSWADWDRDGDPDLLVLGHGGRGSVAYRNDGGRFAPAELAHVSGRRWVAASFGDYDGDGWVDLHLVGWKRAAVLRNLGGRFEEVHRQDLVAGRQSAWFDADNDGDLDIFVVQGLPGRTSAGVAFNQPDLLILHGPSGFEVADAGVDGSVLGSGDAAAVADIDRDGRVDIVVSNGHLSQKGPPVLWRNISRRFASATLVLVGDRANPFGFGARIRFGRRWVYLNDGMSGPAQSEVGYVHLGLGRAARVEVEVEVIWPDGTRDCLRVRAAARREVAQGSAPCPPISTRNGVALRPISDSKNPEG